MNITTQISRHLLEVSQGGNWTEVNVQNTLADITVQEATSLTAASANTIAALVHHLTYWNRIMVERINGVNVDVPDSNGFDVPDIKTTEEWDFLRNSYQASAGTLADAISHVDEHRLLEPILPGYTSVCKNLQGSVEHIHYHLGQITLIKRLVRNTQ